jgi:hypothetical protein
VDPHHLDADPDSTYHPDADPNLDPDPTFHPDADSDPVPDPSVQIKAQTQSAQIGLFSLHTFLLFSAN